MNTALHITSGDMAGDLLSKSGVPGEILVWHDVLYDGRRAPGWPDDNGLEERARFLCRLTGGGLSRQNIRETLDTQYERLASAAGSVGLVLWFDGCLFDQSMLCHILVCLRSIGVSSAELLCVDRFPGIDPYHGLGQLTPEQLASVYGRRRPVEDAQFLFAEQVERAFALQDRGAFERLAGLAAAPLPWVPAAVSRWLAEQPDPVTGLGRLETLALAAVRGGCTTPAQVFSNVSARETPPQFWGDITLWQKINGLADRKPPLVSIDGPGGRLPQWQGIADLKLFRLSAPSVDPAVSGRQRSSEES